jgi:hypothetical protein
MREPGERQRNEDKNEANHRRIVARQWPHRKGHFRAFDWANA